MHVIICGSGGSRSRGPLQTISKTGLHNSNLEKWIMKMGIAWRPKDFVSSFEGNRWKGLSSPALELALLRMDLCGIRLVWWGVGCHMLMVMTASLCVICWWIDLFVFRKQVVINCFQGISLSLAFFSLKPFEDRCLGPRSPRNITLLCEIENLNRKFKDVWVPRLYTLHNLKQQGEHLWWYLRRVNL